MESRKFEKLGIETALLGFGCMRFPLMENGDINEAEAEKMIDTAMAGGVNYIDTALPYHDGNSEPFVGSVLQKYDRGSYFLATKLPGWAFKTLEEAKEIFQKQLVRLQTDYVDFYLLHALNAKRWQQMLELGILEYCEQLKAEGKIKYFGFSFHDDYEVFETIINYREWDFCQLQLNYMDMEEQAGIKGYKLAQKLGVPVIVMEPVKGGSLAKLPDDIKPILMDIRPEASISSWALRWVANLSGVKVILSGMSNMEQTLDNLHTFTKYEPLNEREQVAIDKVAAALCKRVQNGCTGCQYCLPCPSGVNIPANFKVWNEYHIYRNTGATKWTWMYDIADGEKAKNCIECGKCEAECPQKISIREDLKEVQKDMESACI